MSTRAFWYAAEAVHAVVYFADEAATVYEEIGLRGWWMGYFASRAAALGPVGPAPVTALFHGFAPPMVTRALPDAWARATPAAVLGVRQDLAVTALERAGVSGDSAALTGPLVAGLTYAGRPLAAAHAALSRPDDPLRALWWDCTVLREYRGDGHVAALVAAGLDGCEANVLMRGLGLVPERQQKVRGWTDDDWSAAQERLRRKGFLAEGGMVTRAGRDHRDQVEAATDRTVSDVRPSDGLTEQLSEAARVIAATGAISYPNPVGIPAAT